MSDQMKLTPEDMRAIIKDAQETAALSLWITANSQLSPPPHKLPDMTYIIKRAEEDRLLLEAERNRSAASIAVNSQAKSLS